MTCDTEDKPHKYHPAPAAVLSHSHLAHKYCLPVFCGNRGNPSSIQLEWESVYRYSQAQHRLCHLQRLWQTPHKLRRYHPSEDIASAIASMVVKHMSAHQEKPLYNLHNQHICPRPKVSTWVRISLLRKLSYQPMASCIQGKWRSFHQD